MLSHISIRHYTVVESLEVEFHSGLTVVTGETGAGKSIILDALGLCLGDRADPKAIRPGAERAEVHATFLIKAIPDASEWLQARELDAGDELLLRRVLNSDGRSRAYINGRPATLQDCSALGELLIDIHGQHAHQSLLRRSQQRALLDEYAGVQLTDLATLAGQWRSRQESLQEITHRQREHADREQLLRYQVEELDALALGEDELEQLETELRQLENAETIQREAADSIDYCEAGASAAHAALSALTPELHSGRRMEEIREMLESSAIQLGEARAELNQYLADRESDPERLEEIRKRLETSTSRPASTGSCRKDWRNCTGHCARNWRGWTAAMSVWPPCRPRSMRFAGAGKVLRRR
jgi:DNA repair protein RecN (Recombination protein N)